MRGASDCSNEALHEWRMRTKDLRYELEMLETVWPEMLRPLAEQAHQLTNLLGEDHDLAVLRGVVQEQADGEPSTDDELLFALIDERRATLQKQAAALGDKLYEERPTL